MKKSLRVIISGGGTGGHIYPAIAIADALKRMDGEAVLLFIGSLGRMEMEKVPKAGYEIKGLPIAGLQRRELLKNFLLPLKVINSLIRARKMINEFKPEVVVGVGGYASGPVLFSATLMKIPTLIQEQNSFAGITNKILGKRVNKICVAYDGMEKFFPENKIVITGNPVRKDLTDVVVKREKALSFFGLNPAWKTLLVIGGSLGAKTINDSVREHLSAIKDKPIQLLWQTGRGYYHANSIAAASFSPQVKVHEFIYEMDLAYAAADVVISRAGAISISELCVVAKPCILVPSPNVAEDHQAKNAMALVNKDAALLVTDAEAPEKLFSTAMALLEDIPLQNKLKTNIAMLAKPDADAAIANEVVKLVSA